jgi:hypothetical protein
VALAEEMDELVRVRDVDLSRTAPSLPLVPEAGHELAQVGSNYLTA